MLAGFALLVSACGHDACEALPVSERLYSSRQACQQMLVRLQARRPTAVLMCGEVYREKQPYEGGKK
ncbi:MULTISPECIES: hypothetical protein [Serratia]|uniref:hypothetical protein n=1 Tax=Serratia TaxID=613 RepID=UPI00065F6E56|nr:hypothetical protein [Serratia sp. 506_PEND]